MNHRFFLLIINFHYLLKILNILFKGCNTIFLILLKYTFKFINIGHIYTDFGLRAVISIRSDTLISGGDGTTSKQIENHIIDFLKKKNNTLEKPFYDINY